MRVIKPGTLVRIGPNDGWPAYVDAVTIRSDNSVIYSLEWFDGRELKHGTFYPYAIRDAGESKLDVGFDASTRRYLTP